MESRYGCLGLGEEARGIRTLYRLPEEEVTEGQKRAKILQDYSNKLYESFFLSKNYLRLLNRKLDILDKLPKNAHQNFSQNQSKLQENEFNEQLPDELKYELGRKLKFQNPKLIDPNLVKLKDYFISNSVVENSRTNLLTYPLQAALAGRGTKLKLEDEEVPFYQETRYTKAGISFLLR